jgi:hypothetical protein
MFLPEGDLVREAGRSLPGIVPRNLGHSGEEIRREMKANIAREDVEHNWGRLTTSGDILQIMELQVTMQNLGVSSPSRCVQPPKQWLKREANINRQAIMLTRTRQLILISKEDGKEFRQEAQGGFGLTE